MSPTRLRFWFLLSALATCAAPAVAVAQEARGFAATPQRGEEEEVAEEEAAQSDAGGEQERFEPVRPRPAVNAAAEGDVSAPSASVADDDVFTCPPAKLAEGTYYVCAEVERGRFRSPTMYPPNRRIIEPNRAIVVAVAHSSRFIVRARGTGVVGIYRPGLDTGDLAEGAPGTRGGEAAPRHRRVVTRHVVPPQLPGGGGIQLVLIDTTTGNAVDELSVEFVVEEHYSGALRIGVGAAFGGARDGHYEVRTVPESGQPEVTADSTGFATIELVLGYAAFLESEGRPSRGCRATPWCFAPYFGVGVLSATPDDDVRFLTSLYLGLEIEPVRNFSIAAAAMGRRATRLADGFDVGGPATTGTDVTTNAFALGFGIVLNLSPSFFKVAASSAASGGLP